MGTKKKKPGGARPGAGRRRLRPGEITVQMSVKMTESQKRKLMKLGGGGWVRERVDEAHDPITLSGATLEGLRDAAEETDD
jgi:hypothetical protein